jgi:hypothetical protein
VIKTRNKVGNEERWLVVAAVLLTVAVTVEAQQPKKVPRIGYLSSTYPATESIRAEAIRLALRALSNIDGQNVAIASAFDPRQSGSHRRTADDLDRCCMADDERT